MREVVIEDRPKGAWVFYFFVGLRMSVITKLFGGKLKLTKGDIYDAFKKNADEKSD